MLEYFFVKKDYESELFNNIIVDFTYPHVYEAGKYNRNMFFYAAADEGEMVGLAVVEIKERIARLHSIAVVEDRRRERIASSLINGICEALKQTNVCWMDAILTDNDEQKNVVETLLKSLYFEVLSADECIGTVSLKDCREHEVIKHYIPKSDNIFRYDELSDAEIRMLDKKLKYEGVYSALTDEGISREYSFFYGRNDEISGFILISKDSDELNIDYAYVSPDFTDKMALLKLLGAATEKALEDLPLDTHVHVACINGISAKLFNKLFPNCATVTTVRRYGKSI